MSVFKENMKKNIEFKKVMEERGFYVSGTGFSDTSLIYRLEDVGEHGLKKPGTWHIGSISGSDIRNAKTSNDILTLANRF
jgi:hypothetical protein